MDAGRTRPAVGTYKDKQLIERGFSPGRMPGGPVRKTAPAGPRVDAGDRRRPHGPPGFPARDGLRAEQSRPPTRTTISNQVNGASAPLALRTARHDGAGPAPRVAAGLL